MADTKQSGHDALRERREMRKTLPRRRETSIDRSVRECEDGSPDVERLEHVRENEGSGQ